MRSRLLSAAFSFSVGACQSGAPAKETCGLGDPVLPPEFVLVYRSTDGEVLEVHEGDSLPLMLPPQGGKVLFVGVRARNVACMVDLNASLRDECSNRILGLDQRPVRLIAGNDGWGAPDPAQFSDFANLPTCPTAAAERNVNGQSYLLHVQLSDNGRTADRSVHIVPTCPVDGEGAECRCECNALYRLGQVCPADIDPGQPVACPGRPDAGGDDI